MDRNFQAYSTYYDMLNSGKDYAAEASYISNAIRLLQKDALTILEYGCGTGNHAGYLCNDGFEITGLERSSDMVAIAEGKNIRGFKPKVADIVSYDLGEKFDTVIALFHVMSYLVDNKDLINCFQSTNRHLKQDGYFIFDIWYAPAVYSQKVQARVKRIENDLNEVIRIAEPEWHYEKNVIDVNYEILVRNKEYNSIERFEELHPMRFFSVPEIELIARQTGFEFVKAEEFLSGKSPGVDTWGVCFFFKKFSNV